MRDAEVFGSIAAIHKDRQFTASELAGAWELLLLNQFHDILPGSSIAEVYPVALSEHSKLQETASASLDKSLAALSSGKPSAKPDAIQAFNSLSWTRSDIAEASIPASSLAKAASVVSPSGTVLPFQTLERNAKDARICFRADAIPQVGFSTFRLSEETSPAKPSLSASKSSLENEFLRIRLSKNGDIVSIFDKRASRELLPKGALANELQLFQDGPEGEDAWNVHRCSTKRKYPFDKGVEISVLDCGSVRAAVKVLRKKGRTSIEQVIAVYSGIPRIDFITKADWQERHTLLKAAFPLDIRSTKASYEIQFGTLERPTHRNTSWDQEKFEVPAQRWADISETGYGVSLINDSRYGYDILENVMRLTLLRSPCSPDAEADKGLHEFRYSLLPHEGSWTDASVARRAMEFNVPIRTSAVSAGKSQRPSASFISFDGIETVMEAFKPAEDGRGFILRVYEPHGASGKVNVSMTFSMKSVNECNHVEDEGAEVALSKGSFSFDIRPFQILSFRMLP